MRDKIYYLMDFHKKCTQIMMYGDELSNRYCDFVNAELNKHFSVEEQKQLKLHNFNYDIIYEFAFGDVDGISFDGLDDVKLFLLFDQISFVDLDMFD